MVGFKTILVPFAGKFNEVNVLKTGFSLAKLFEARVQVLHISPDPQEFIQSAYSGVSTPFVTFEGVLEELEKHNKKEQEEAQQVYNKFFDQHVTTCSNKEEAACAFLQQEIGNAKDIISLKGRMSDLIVMSTAFEEDKTRYDGSTIGALFNTGRPVLLIPPHSHYDDITKLNNVIISWNGSKEAMRAVISSLPLLHQAKQINILTIQEEGDDELPISAQELSQYLEQHNIKSDVIIQKASDTDATEVIFAKAKDKNADMIIMGAYSHNRLWETFFGGVTDFMLKNTTIPVLMAH